MNPEPRVQQQSLQFDGYAIYAQNKWVYMIGLLTLRVFFLGVCEQCRVKMGPDFPISLPFFFFFFCQFEGVSQYSDNV